jgi:hypothetical protein
MGVPERCEKTEPLLKNIWKFFLFPSEDVRLRQLIAVVATMQKGRVGVPFAFFGRFIQSRKSAYSF